MSEEEKLEPCCKCGDPADWSKYFCWVCAPEKDYGGRHIHTRRVLDRVRQGCAPLRKRKKRLHNKLAKRGFSASPTSIILASPVKGYGIEGTKWDR